MAGFNLQEFMSNNIDFARGYTFYILVTNPTGGLGTDRTKYLVKSSTLPASTIEIAETNWQGNAYKLGTTQSFAEFSTTFNVDPTDQVRHNFVEWMRFVHDPETNFHGVPTQYMQDITLQHLDQYTGAIIMTYKLIAAWPTSVSEMTLDYASKSVAEFSVNWAYQYHTTE